MEGSQNDGALSPGTLIGDHFVVQGRLGGGGMGDVYLAENLNLPDRHYAIKVLRPEYSADPRFAELLHAEARKQSRLEHDNVVQIYDFLVWEQRCCLVQTFIKGQTLARLLDAQPQGLALEQTLAWMLDVLAALDFAHQMGILHCDVKPGNVIVDENGRARVTDFGISRDLGGGADDGSLAGAGTAGYMSPEQIQPPYAIDHRSDVYAAGILMFEMLTGRLPFGEPGATSFAEAQLQSPAPDVRTLRAEVPEAVARIVSTALQREPDRRFQGCGDFRQAIVDHQRQVRWRRTWLPAIVGGTVFAVVGLAGLYYWREVQREKVEAESAAVRVREAAVKQEASAVQARNRQTANDSIRNAAAALNLLCRESAELKIKRHGLELSRQLMGTPQDKELVLKFEQRVADMERNVQTHAGSYLQALKRLNAMERDVVAEALLAQAAADPQVDAVKAEIGADEAQARAGTGVGDAAELIRRCKS